jgi:hypothetical protein
VPARVPVAHLGYWLMWAIHGYLTSLCVGASHSAALAGAGAYVLAPIAGFLALASPSGIGIREAILSMVLMPTMGAAPAVAAAIMSRATSMLIDVLSWAVARIVARHRSATA